jgi:hypothetical protein
MLRMYVMDKPLKWEDYLHLVEFTYNNGYQASLKMSPFGELFGRKCNTPVSWDNVDDRTVVGLEFLKEMEDQMIKIKQNLKVAQDRQKHYANKKRTHREFKVGDHVFLKVKANRSSLKLGSYAKLAARFCGPLEILESIGLVAYMIALPSSMFVHIVFHVSLLKQYIPNANNVIDWNVIQVEQEGIFQVHLVRILDWKFKQLWNQAIGIVKVQWTWYGLEDATWEHEDAMWTRDDFFRKTRPRRNKIKQMQKQNTEDTQYKRDTDLHGSPSVGYIHQRNFQVLPLLLSSK